MGTLVPWCEFRWCCRACLVLTALPQTSHTNFFSSLCVVWTCVVKFPLAAKRLPQISHVNASRSQSGRCDRARCDLRCDACENETRQWRTWRQRVRRNGRPFWIFCGRRGRCAAGCPSGWRGGQAAWSGRGRRGRRRGNGTRTSAPCGGACTCAPTWWLCRTAGTGRAARPGARRGSGWPPRAPCRGWASSTADTASAGRRRYRRAARTRPGPRPCRSVSAAVRPRVRPAGGRRARGDIPTWNARPSSRRCHHRPQLPPAASARPVPVRPPPRRRLLHPLHPQCFLNRVSIFTHFLLSSPSSAVMGF